MVWLQRKSGTYLIIAPGDLIHAISQLIDQKRRRGYEVEIKLVETFVAHGLPKYEEIRRYVLDKDPDFLLLVGDYDTMPSSPLNLSGTTCRSDNYFSMTDNDSYPLVPTGRLSTNNANVLSQICDRLVAYPANLDPEWRRRVVLTGWLPRAPDTPNTDWTKDATYQCMSEIGAYYDVSIRDSVLNLKNYISRYARVPSICRTAQRWIDPSLRGKILPRIYLRSRRCILSWARTAWSGHG